MLKELQPVYVETMPDAIEQGKLYISQKFGVAIHLCACGCGGEVVTPLRGPHSWTLSADGTLWPSIGNQPCRSHYWVTEFRVVPC
jgi:hypothetical protein